jgi:aminoglycoside 6'-N-acetyltransferase
MADKGKALLVIDVQRELFRKAIPIHRADELLKNLLALVKRAHAAGAPVIYVRHASKAGLVRGSEGWQLHERLSPLKTDLVIDKTHPSAFEGTRLQEELAALGVKRLVVTGLVTHGCVRATTLEALKRGYEVVLVGDAHSNYHARAAGVVKEWNERLAEAGARVLGASAVRF